MIFMAVALGLASWPNHPITAADVLRPAALHAAEIKR